MKKILIVDDDPDILDAVELILQIAGYEVIPRSRASGIAEIVRSRNPDLILLDIMIAGTDGRSICQLLKRSARFCKIPILLFSASNIPKTDMLRCGADDFIPKPFDMDELLQRIDRLLQPGTKIAQTI